MHTKLFSWLSLLGLLALLTLEAAAQNPAATPAVAGSSQVAGEIRATRVIGKVTYEDIATKVTKVVTENLVIAQGTIVRTEANSSVVLLFANGATVNLAYSSELNIEQFTLDPFAGNYEPAKATDEPSVSTTNLKLTHGELVGNVKKLKQGANGSKFTVGTPVGAAGIRGTTFRIVYRPSGDGRSFNFTLTTVEGNVEVQIASGTGITPPAPVSVTDSKEVVINNVEVNTTTNQVVATTSTGQTVAVTTAPPPVNAAVTTVAQVTAVAQVLAQAVVAVVFVSPTPPANTPAPPTNSTPPPTTTEKKEDTSGTPGNTTTPTRITTP